MWPGFDGTLYTREQFAAHVASLTIPPYAKFVVMHATGAPTLKQWQAYPEAQRVANLQRYYEQSLHWQHGPHLFIGPNDIAGFSDLRVRGTHCSCWNFDSIGIETAGDWNVEDFNSGDGAKVRDNFVFAAAVLHKHLGLRPDNYVKGVSGLHLHRECAADGHFECPHADNAGFDKADIVKRILAAMDALPALVPNPALVASAAKLPANWSTGAPIGSVAWVQGRLNAWGASPALIVDGDRGAKTVAALTAFQSARGLVADGIAGPATIETLQGAPPAAAKAA
ncbi:MAG: peptidoglycan-binding domain-containing protein [Roseiarcus sp.]|jgi:hypothetical protein